jgi:hypothetical protein
MTLKAKIDAALNLTGELYRISYFTDAKKWDKNKNTNPNNHGLSFTTVSLSNLQDILHEIEHEINKIQETQKKENLPSSK